MKNIYMTAAVLFVTGSCLKAQPTITAENFNPVEGETADEYPFDTTGFDPGPSGAFAVWNFPMLSGSGGHPVEVLSSLSTPHAPIFAGSNIAISHAPLDYDYYLAHVNGLEYMGTGNSVSGETVYTDPAALLTYPFTFLSVSVDSFEAHYSMGSKLVTRKGEIVSTGDAYGVLSSPTGTYNDVLRIKLVMTFDDTAEDTTGMQEVTHHEQTWYYWVKEDIHFPLLTYMEDRVTEAGEVRLLTRQAHTLIPNPLCHQPKIQKRCSPGFCCTPILLTATM